MPRGRATPITLSEGERAELTALVRRRRTAQDLALRARIVLRCADGLTNQAVAKELDASAHTVGKWPVADRSGAPDESRAIGALVAVHGYETPRLRQAA